MTKKRKRIRLYDKGEIHPHAPIKSELTRLPLFLASRPNEPHKTVVDFERENSFGVVIFNGEMFKQKPDGDVYLALSKLLQNKMISREDTEDLCTLHTTVNMMLELMYKNPKSPHSRAMLKSCLDRFKKTYVQVLMREDDEYNVLIASSIVLKYEYRVRKNDDFKGTIKISVDKQLVNLLEAGNSISWIDMTVRSRLNPTAAAIYNFAYGQKKFREKQTSNFGELRNFCKYIGVEVEKYNSAQLVRKIEAASAELEREKILRIDLVEFDTTNLKDAGRPRTMYAVQLHKLSEAKKRLNENNVFPQLVTA